MSMDGRLEQLGGDKWRLRFTRELAHAPETVWRAITEPDQLAAWFPDGISGDWQIGATLTFGSREVGTFTGEVLSVDRPKSLENTWGTAVRRSEAEPPDAGRPLRPPDRTAGDGKPPPHTAARPGG